MSSNSSKDKGDGFSISYFYPLGKSKDKGGDFEERKRVYQELSEAILRLYALETFTRWMEEPNTRVQVILRDGSECSGIFYTYHHENGSVLLKECVTKLGETQVFNYFHLLDLSSVASIRVDNHDLKSYKYMQEFNKSKIAQDIKKAFPDAKLIDFKEVD